MPAKRRLISAPGRLIENDGLRASAPLSSKVIWVERLATYFNSSSISRDFAPSSRDATISIGWVTRSRYDFNWVLRLASNIRAISLNLRHKKTPERISPGRFYWAVQLA